jgi:hypothetical protein
MKKYICGIAAASTILLASCAVTPSKGAAQVRDADEKIIENCHFVADVEGTSGWGNLAASAGIANARNEAREKAAAAGATHIVWRSVTGAYSPTVSGRAYQCSLT